MSLVPQTFWLTVMNIALGALVILGCLAAAAGRLSETLSKLRKRRSFAVELNHDMEQMFGPPRPGVAAPSAAVLTVGVARAAKSWAGFLRRLRSGIRGIRGKRKERSMAIIVISRGTFSGGKMLAECLSRRLGYRCIDRDELVEKAATRRVSQREIRAALEEPPAFPGRFNHKRYLYLALIQAALVEEVRAGEAIYHGLAGHLLLKGAPALLRLRIVAPLEFRVRMAQERLKLGRDEVIAYIGKMDQDRRKWTQFLYGVDWGDPSLYDLVINLERVTIEQACHLAIDMLAQPGFKFSPECQAAMDDFALASQVRARLAADPFTSNLEVEVESSGGRVSIKGDIFDQSEEVRRLAWTVPGVTGLDIGEFAEANSA